MSGKFKFVAEPEAGESAPRVIVEITDESNLEEVVDAFAQFLVAATYSAKAVGERLNTEMFT